MMMSFQNTTSPSVQAARAWTCFPTINERLPVLPVLSLPLLIAQQGQGPPAVRCLQAAAQAVLATPTAANDKMEPTPTA
eukprot:CAMPEP_0119110226 /NCGR_PEP_ID=MMETSP1180-20130426/27877_1 /TAXON_ID=3052 ORGANISM="Chlamydomonas cf sp, Strain CCMP681" /NCGR_SAMPLE_ID=MMETSP1180 /ASSEMBLY_ACC=CAM_ASM_000741 /LENGTH=78 /DNA_ID=CAMNT_0007096437 /DNA_START=502 /DNA_END=736 /DNA_ORIENTATION=+